MKLNHLQVCLALAFVLTMTVPLRAQISGAKVPDPIPPEIAAKRRMVTEIRAEAERLVESGQPLEAVPVFEAALAMERSISPQHIGSIEFQIAKAYVQAQRTSAALAWFARAFKWNPENQEVEIIGPPLIRALADYAILLAEQGRPEDAKAIYYTALRRMAAWTARENERVPFIVVFDPEPDGISWEYSLNRFKAACLMAIANHSGLPKERIAQVKALAPDWFYPDAVLAAKHSMVDAFFQRAIDRADALAKPGLEKAFVAQVRSDVAELERRSQESWNVEYDRRPMTEGNERRARMQCLRPNPEVLSRLCPG